MFATSQMIFGWETFVYKHYYGSDKLPNPRPTPTQNKLGENWHLGHFLPQQTILRGLGLILNRKKTTKNPTQPNYTKLHAVTVLDATWVAVDISALSPSLREWHHGELRIP